MFANPKQSVSRKKEKYNCYSKYLHYFYNYIFFTKNMSTGKKDQPPVPDCSSPDFCNSLKIKN
jgi:hypothetical protein